MMMFLSLTPFRLLVIAIYGAALTTADKTDVGFANLVAWMIYHGGRVYHKLDVATMNGIRGVVTLDNIEVGTELLFCPWKLIIGSTSMEDQMQHSVGKCDVVKRMAEEIRLNEGSLWHPYLSHIDIPRLVADWDEDSLNELQNLDPQDTKRHIQWFRQSCEDEVDVASMRSLVAFVSRASEVGMVPIYDLLNHHNGKRNAKLTISEHGVHLTTVTSVAAGEELYLSYGIKTAPTMFRDYGFVEDWPVCWNFRTPVGDNFAFVLYREVVAINPTGDLLKQIWQSNKQLVEYQSDAKRHMDTLSIQELHLFSLGAKNYLDGLPTTLEQDELFILERKTKAIDSPSGSTQAEKDIISAIDYRMLFKKALIAALEYTNTEIQSTAGHEL